MSNPLSGGDDPDVDVDLSKAAEPIRKTHQTEDPFFVPAWTRTLESIAEALRGVPSRPILDARSEPGRSEFSHGRGRMPPLTENPEPSQIAQLHAVYRTDPADPGAPISYESEIRE